MKKLLTILALASVGSTHVGLSQNTTWNYDFGTGTGSLTGAVTNTNTFVPPPTGGGTNIFRVGTQGGGWELVNPGDGSLLVGTAATGGSINKFTTFNYDNATTAFTLAFDMTLAGGDSGIWSLFTGDGASFESAGTGFASAQTFTALRFAYTAGGGLAISNRSAATWVALNGTGIAQDSNFSISIYGNNGLDAIVYDGNTLAANTWDLWVNGTKTVAGIAKGALPNEGVIDSFMFIGETSTANAATIQLDNISYSNFAVPEPSTYALLALSGLALAGYAVRRRRRAGH
jgi:hypothetical protein